MRTSFPMSGVLVVRPSSLGDIVHALAIVSDIREHRPEISIDWVAEDVFVPLVALDRGIRRVIPVALRRWRRHPLDASTWREAAAFRRELRRDDYVAVLDLQEQVKGAYLSWLARGPRHGPDRASIREPIATVLHQYHHAIDRDQHLIDRCRQLAAAALGYRAAGPPRFGLTAPPPGAGATIPDRPYVVALHATSRADKLWPEAHWRTVIAAFARSGLAVVLPWGDENERLRSERLAAGEAAASVPPRQPLPALATLLSRAELAVGVDTGLVHLAAALATPTIALFVATDARLAGVARASSLGRDLGGAGIVPSVDDVQRTAGELMLRAPRC
jgi:heptosyltransferase-1